MRIPTWCVRVGVALGLVVAAPAFAASLDGQPITIDWWFPTTSDLFASKTVVAGDGAGLSCDGYGLDSGVCAAFPGPASVGVDDRTISLMVFSSGYGFAPFGFNGLEFSGLAAGGHWTGYELVTDFAGMDSSRITFTPDALWVDMAAIHPAAGQSFTITLLTSDVPEPPIATLLLAGVGLGLAAAATRRRRVGARPCA